MRPQKAMLICLFTIANSAFGQPQPGQGTGQWVEDEVFAQYFVDYQNALIQRENIATHHSSLIDTLGAASSLIGVGEDIFVGRVLAAGEIDGEDVVLIWNADSETALVLVDGSLTAMDTIMDASGRIAFSTGEYSGVFDIEGGSLLIQLADGVWLTGESEGLPTDPTVPVAPDEKKCVCSGTNDLCPGGNNDCQNQENCWVEQAQENRRCVFAKRTIDSEQGGCGSSSVSVPAVFVPPGIVAIGLARRRRPIRRAGSAS